MNVKYILKKYVLKINPLPEFPEAGFNRFKYLKLSLR